MHKIENIYIYIYIMYKIFKFNAEKIAKNCVHTIKVTKTDNKSVVWIKMIDIQKKLDVKNINVPVDKEIKGKFKTNNPTNEQIKKYKKHGSELIAGENFFDAHESITIPVIMHLTHQNHVSLKKV